MTTLKRINDYIIHISIAIIFFIFGFIIINNNITKNYFDYELYRTDQEIFIKCVNDKHLQEKAHLFNESFLNFSLERISSEIALFNNVNNCDSSHVISSYEQVQEMALVLLEEAKVFYDSDNVLFVNAVYTSNSFYNALLNQPQEYMFFVSDEKQERIVALTIRPNNDNYITKFLWDIEKSNDLDFTQNSIKKLLLVYNEIKR